MDVREFYKWLQVCDIDMAERPIFEAWLEMALANGAIPLPLTKFDKFNQPAFQGRRWDSVQPIDDIRADRLAVEGNLNSRTRLLAEAGRDFEEVIEELAMEKVIIEEAGLQIMPVKVSNDAASETEPADAPADGNANAATKKSRKREVSRV
jgi:capsid protein